MISRLFARSRLLFVTLLLTFAWAGTGGAPSHAQNLPEWAEPRAERSEGQMETRNNGKGPCPNPKNKNCEDGELCPNGNCENGPPGPPTPPNKVPLSGQWLLVIAAMGLGAWWLYNEDGRQLYNSEVQALPV